MNTKLAEAIGETLRSKWSSVPEGSPRELDSEEIYHDLIARGIHVPEGDMSEVLDQFRKAGIIGGPGYMNSDANKQHGAMVITSVDQQLLDYLDFD